MPGCVYTASIGNARAGNALSVFVETLTSSTGALVDRPFHLFVNC